MVEKAEMDDAVEAGIYRDLVGDHGTAERAVAREKTRHRMRTRLKNNRVIGPPINGRTEVSKRRLSRHASRLRFDADLGRTVSWSAYAGLFPSLKNKEVRSRWRRLPRMRLPPRHRMWDELRSSKQDFLIFSNVERI